MRILVFQHLSVEHPGVFRKFWKDDGHEWFAVELDEGEAIPPLEDFDALFVMGGPMDVWQRDLYAWLDPEITAIRHWVRDLTKPYVGICLGHQLLAEALGGSVGLMARPEVGLASVELTPAGLKNPVFKGLGPEVSCLQWHGAEVTRLPEGSEILASNSHCPVQSFAWGRHAYGFQYHCEITASTIDEWNEVPAYQESLKAVLGPDGAPRLAEDVASNLSSLNKSARKLHENLTKIMQRSLVLG